MGEQKRHRLTAKRKFDIYLETRKEGAKIGEILRREGIHLNDLRAIEDLVERGAVGALKMKGAGRGIRRKIDPIEHEHLKEELQRKEKAMSDLMVEYQLLKKSELSESREPSRTRSSGIRIDAAGSWMPSKTPRRRGKKKKKCQRSWEQACAGSSDGRPCRAPPDSKTILQDPTTP
jgi:hypothetical protein